MPSSPEPDAGTETSAESDTARIRQQAVVADLGQLALETDDLDRLLEEAATAVAETLAVDSAAVFEAAPDEDAAVLREGVGWRTDVVGSATVPIDGDSLVGETLGSEQPVRVDALGSEDRFSELTLLTEHDVVSAVNVSIGSNEVRDRGRDGTEDESENGNGNGNEDEDRSRDAAPWGVLGVYTTERREFSNHEVTFLQRVADVLTPAIDELRTKRQLREREQELEETFDRITDAFIGLDQDWEITYINDRAAELLDPGGVGLVGENFWDPFEPALGTTFEEEYRKTMGSQEPTSFEEYYPPLETWFEVHAYPSKSGLSIYFRDVTERREHERERELFRTLLDRINDSVLVIDPETAQFLDVNETACRHLGYDRDELLELSVLEMERRFDDLDDWRAHVEEVHAEGSVTVEGVHERNDGTTYPAEVNVTYVELDQEYLVAIARDITERRQRERRLRASEQQYRTLAENFPNGVVTMFDDDLEYVLAAGQAFDELPVAPTDVEGESIRTVWPDHVSEAIESAYRTLDGDTRTKTIETAYADREWRIYVVPIDDQQGTVFGGMTIAQDITARKEYQRKLEESNERLEQFAYAASHDLQEPLRMISSYLSLIERRYGDDFDDDGEEFLAFAIDGANRMREMIDGLLEYSRVDTQGDPMEPVDLDDVLERARENLQVKIAESDAEITVASLPRVRGDESQLQQVFQNLLSNAIEYSGDEPPRVRVDAERLAERRPADRSATAAATDGPMWAISVHDEGIGIDSADQDRVFEVFQRLHSREAHSGTGIGLALCQRIAERHGGTIRVDSEPGEGSTFTVTLPAVDADE